MARPAATTATEKTDVRGDARADVRAEQRSKLRAGQFSGRDGEILMRRRDFDDPYEIPQHLKEPGWSYQWNRVSALGKPDGMEITRMQAAGWRFVNPESRLGQAYYMNEGIESGWIEIGGLALMERPQGMTDEANEEHRQANIAQAKSLRDRSTDMKMPSGFNQARKQINIGARECIPDDDADGFAIPS
jgi:hypothetical protein